MQIKNVLQPACLYQAAGFFFIFRYYNFATTMTSIKILFLISISFLGILGLPNVGYAQKNKQLPWRKRAKLAAEYIANGNFKQAATHYKSIYTQHPEKLNYTYEAGLAYLSFRDYKNAIKSLEPVAQQSNIYNKAGYYYALALKQIGQTQLSKAAFENFLVDYQGEDKALYKKLVDNEIRGCNYSLKAKLYTDPTVTITHLPHPINTNKTEFAPIPFGDNILYFSTTSKGVAKINRSQKEANGWSTPQVPHIFMRNMEKPHFGNGTFSADGKRFYFTQCEVTDQPSCAIYVMSEENGQWSTPKMLPDYVNANNSNTTHPHLVTTDKEEILYFSSSRPGGRGGLDIWYTSRSLNGGNFNLPKNLGRNINTQGDDISPFYDSDNQILYFSSNGRVSAGGLDVFKSKGEKLQWEVAQNMGFPINSSADDLYYTVSPAHGGGYIVSNRTFEPQRSTTTDDDIFYFAQEQIVIELSGKIQTKPSSEVPSIAHNVNVKLFEIAEAEEQLIAEQLLEEGIFALELDPQKNYLIICEKDGFEISNEKIQTGNKSAQINLDIHLKPIPKVVEAAPDWDAIKYSIMPPEYNSNDNPFELPKQPIDKDGIPYEGNSLTIYKELKEVAMLGDEHKLYYDLGGDPQPYQKPVLAAIEPTNNSAATIDNDNSTPQPTLYEAIYNEQKIAPDNIVYKIQVSAVRKFRASKYEPLKEVGQLEMERISSDLKRVLIVDSESEVNGFKSKGKALNVLGYILNNTVFEYAFVIKYVDGKRVGEGYRGWDEEEGLNDRPTKSQKKKYGGF